MHCVPMTASVEGASAEQMTHAHTEGSRVPNGSHPRAEGSVHEHPMSLEEVRWKLASAWSAACQLADQQQRRYSSENERTKQSTSCATITSEWISFLCGQMLRYGAFLVCEIDCA